MRKHSRGSDTATIEQQLEKIAIEAIVAGEIHLVPTLTMIVQIWVIPPSQTRSIPVA